MKITKGLPVVVLASLLSPHPTPPATPKPPKSPKPPHAAGRWIWPIPPADGATRPVVLRGFEPPHSRWGPGHRGIDIAAGPDGEVRAAGAGTITFAGEVAGTGVVAISHGKLRTTYEPVVSSVHVGDHVTAGQRIGTVAPEPHHCTAGLCLHLGLLGPGKDQYLDPMLLFATVRIGLLPIGPGLTWR